jgi:hypothetical protein
MTDTTAQPDRIWAQPPVCWCGPGPRHDRPRSVEYIRADRHDTAISELVEGLRGFVSYYPRGINLDLDDAQSAARALIAKYGDKT